MPAAYPDLCVRHVPGYNPEAIQTALDTQIAEVLDMSHKTHIKIRPSLPRLLTMPPEEEKPAISIKELGLARQGASVDQLSEALDQMSEDLEADKQRAQDAEKTEPAKKDTVSKNSSDVPGRAPGKPGPGGG